jgi:hypothetical protein
MIQLGDHIGRSYAARVVKYTDPGANADRIALVIERELAWNSSHQEPKPLQLMGAGRFARPGHEFVAPFVAPRNAEGAGMGIIFAEKAFKSMVEFVAPWRPVGRRCPPPLTYLITY